MRANTIYMRRVAAATGAGALVPVGQPDHDLLAKIPVRETVAIRVMRGRSVEQNRLYWALLTHVAQATEWENRHKLHNALKLHLGEYDLLKMPNGKVTPVVWSTRFDEMNQSEFQEHFDRAIQAICEYILPGTNSEDLINEVQAMLGGADS